MEQMEWQGKLRALSAGELTPDETANVIREAAESETKAAELQFSQKLTTVLKERDLFEVKGIVAGLMLEEGLPTSPPASWLGNWAVGSWASTLLLLLSTGVFFAGQGWGWWAIDPQALAQQYLAPMENVVYLEDNESASAIEDLRLGMAAYDQQNYPKATQYLKTYYQQVQDGNAGCSWPSVS